MRILITGIAGHLGSKLAEYALQLGAEIEIVGCDNLSCGYVDNVPPVAAFYDCDVTELPPSLFARRFDAIFHFAAYAAECMSPFCRDYNYRNNLLPLAALLNNVIESDARHGRLVFTSSIAVYGELVPPFSESMFCKPKDPYGIAKRACEDDLRVAGEQHAVDYCVLRPHNIYGPGQSIWQRYRNVIGLWMRAILEGQPINVFGDGTQQRAFTYVDDILQPLWNAAILDAAYQKTINLGGAQPVELCDLLQELREVVGHELQMLHLPARHEVKRAWATTARSQAILGYVDRTPLKTGLKEMWEYAKRVWTKYPERRKPLAIPRPEVTRRMPAIWLEDFLSTEAAGG